MDDKFFYDLYKAVKPYILGMLNNASIPFAERNAMADDIFQKAFFIFIEKYDPTAPNSNAKGFFSSICKKLFFEKLRELGKTSHLTEIQEANLSDEEYLGEYFSLTEKELSELNQRKKLIKTLLDCKGELNERHQNLLTLCNWENLPIKEAAAQLGYSLHVAEQTISRCYEKIRDCFKRKGVTL